jgi:hypothetical protein
MVASRKPLCTTLLVAALVVPGLSGCAGTTAATSASRQTGLVEEFVEQLKREDDEAEHQELVSLREMRQEAQEQAREQELGTG